MEWLDKIPKWIQIPLKILLPALCIFSGFLLLISDGLAEKLYLKEFRTSSGFAFGLIFLITLSLIICYVIMFAIDKYKVISTKKSLIKKFKNLQPIYKSALYEMYRTPTHSLKMELSNATASYLINIHAIGSGQVSTMGMVFDFYLQPWVFWGIESEIKDAEKTISYYEKNNKRLKEKEDFEDYKQDYQNAQKFLEFINTPVEEESEDW